MRVVLFALFALSTMLGGCCYCKSAEERKAAKEKKAVERAERAAARAQKKAQEAAMKKKCGSRWGTNTWEDVCIDLVRKKIAYPKTADFAWGRKQSTNEAKCLMFMSSSVECKNAFGVEMEYNFRCKYDPKKDWVTVDYFGK